MENEIIVITVSQFREIIRAEIHEALEIKKGLQSDDKKYTLLEAANYLRLFPSTFRVHQHKIGGVKIGRNWMFTQSELDRFIARNHRENLYEIREKL